MRFAVDTGGTFTDLLVEQDDGRLHMFKAATTPEDPIRGVIDSLQIAADHFTLSLSQLLAEGSLFIHGTTRAINAIITNSTAKTAFLTTKGHPDILVLREGGRKNVFDFTVPYPAPYVPRALTFEIEERIAADGTVLEAMNEAAVEDVLAELKRQKVEAVAVCLLWSIVNAGHEKRLGELIEQHLPDVPYTLSHQLNPSLREYRRASSTAIDASLKPLMGAYMRDLSGQLKTAGFNGRVLIVTSAAGVIDAADAAEKPVHLINSGPSMAPVAGRHFADIDAAAGTAIVADTGGTTYDLSLVRRGQIPWTRETWIGGEYRGHMTGFPSIDVRSIGAGGGSIAWVDDGGLLHVGPQSAAAIPGPAAYGLGGERPTLTDACIVLGYVDPNYFLGGSMVLDAGASARAIEADICGRVGLSLEAAALAIVQIATENMVQAIMDITVNQGIDPAEAVLIGGGGAAGLNSERIAVRLGCPSVIIPDVGAGLSAAGALMSDLIYEARATLYTTSERFDTARVNDILGDLRRQCETFAASAGADALETEITYTAEARYPHQVWEIDVPLRGDQFSSDGEVHALVQDFHAAHEEIFAIQDSESEIEVIGWSARVSCRLRRGLLASLTDTAPGLLATASRPAYFDGIGWIDTKVLNFDRLAVGETVQGPAIVENSFTTVVVSPDAKVRHLPSGSLEVIPNQRN